MSDSKLKKSSLIPALTALIFTLVTFILLPLLETIHIRSADILTLRTVNTLPLEPPPPPIPKREPPPEKPKKRDLSKPKLIKQRRLLPINAILDINLGIAAVGGDFQMNFDITDPGSGTFTNTIFGLSDLDDMPTPITRASPVYPIQAKMRRIEGMVMLEFVVTEDGTVEDIYIVEEHPENIFSNAAKRAVKYWKFRPGIKNGEPVAVRVRQKLTFKLDD